MQVAGEGAVEVRPPSGTADKRWLEELWRSEWGGDIMVSKGRVHHLADVDALIAWDNGERVGAATYWIGDTDCELLSINATVSGKGVGTALLRAVEDQVRQAGRRRVWLITSNDNLDALKFYQRRGYRIVAVYPGAIDEARKTKPSIPEVGYYGIPIHDELELAKDLSS
jgi:ribosomal protein S18 acetylase RimI-like enzyme